MDRECDIYGKEVKCIQIRKPEGKRSLGKLRSRQEDITKVDSKQLEWEGHGLD